MTPKELLILVDSNDLEIGHMEKMEVHQLGVLHRAFSIFIFNPKGQLLLQRRAVDKYHSGGLWTNTCCSHPRWGENMATAVSRRLTEEMGMQCPLAFLFSFTYKASFGNGLTEHELDHIYAGVTDEAPSPNLHEVMDWKYMDKEHILEDLKRNPDQYTAWFSLGFHQLIERHPELFT